MTDLKCWSYNFKGQFKNFFSFLQGDNGVLTKDFISHIGYCSALIAELWAS